MGLAEIFIPSYGFNIKPPLTSSIIIYMKGRRDSKGIQKSLRVRIPEGRYKLKDYVKTFNMEVEKSTDSGTVRSRLRYDPYSNRIHFSVASGEVMEVNNTRLCRMLGMHWKVKMFSNTTPDSKKLFVMPKPCKFNVNGTTMYVYSNVVEMSPLGNVMAHILCMVHLELDGRMETLHRKYTDIHYFPLRMNILDMIEVHLCNVYGEDMEFYGGESSIVVHFRKVAEEK